MSILVTGGAGYIGSHTCVELLKDGYSIVIVDNLINSHKSVIRRVEEISGKTFPFYEADIRDEDALRKIFDEQDIDCVIHFAALKAVGESVFKPLEYYENNLNSTMSLCRVMQEKGVKRLIYSSSATVYRGDNPMPLTEDSATGCINPYGWTKYMCEQILRDIAAAYEGWSVALLRYFNPIGAHESGRIGEDPAGIPNNLIPYITQVAVGKLDRLSIYGNDYDTEDGTCIRDYIHVVDLARGHVAAIQYCKEHQGVEAINLGTGRGTSVLQMVDTFQRVNDVKIPYEFAPRRPGDNATCYACTDKAEEILHWTAQKTLEEMCRDSWRWQSQNPNGYSKE